MSGKVDLKVVLLGKSYAGKTSIVERFIHGRFSGDTVPYQNTIGAAYGSRQVEVDGKSLVLGIWDTAGSERYEAMSRLYYRDARAAILCFDLTEKSSFDRVRFWIGELRANEENCKIYLCATKKDLISKDPTRRAVSKDQVSALASDVQSDVFETSSKTGEQIERLFITVSRDYVGVMKNIQPESSPGSGIQLHSVSTKTKRCFCNS